MIRLTVRSFAEMLTLPAHAQVRILNEQKYPRREPQVFKVPYYQVAAKGIRDYYRAGGNPVPLAAARQRVAQLRPPAKRMNNERALNSFETSSQFHRQLNPTPAPTFRASLPGDIELRMRFDLEALEGETLRRIIFNFRNVAVDPDVARSTLRIAHWVLGESGVAAPIRTIEFVDLLTDRTYTVSRQSQRTIALMMQNAGIITTLWPSLSNQPGT